MIKSLKIKNFKSHTDTDLSFSPLVNAITGVSDSGKTNILRSLNWIINNRPLGDDLIHHGENGAEVNLSIIHESKEIEISRNRGGNKNEYILKSADNEPITYTAFGESIPEIISDELNISEINLQKQFQSYFLVFDSPGQVATYIRSVTKLDEIDKVTDLIISKLRKAQIEEQSIKAEISDVNTQLVELSKIDLQSLELYLLNATEIINKNNSLITSFNRLLDLVNKLVDIDSHRIQIPDDIEEVFGTYSKLSDRALNLTSNYNTLKALIHQLVEIEKGMVKIPDDVDGIINEKIQLVNEYNKNRKDTEQLLGLVSKFNKIVEELADIDLDLTTCMEERSKILEQLDTCPECGSMLTIESKTKLLKKKGITND